MDKDLIYAFDKKTFIGTKLGEAQSDFNMSFVIDGTKDSWQCQVWGYQESEIEPYTIIYHPKTNSWWIVSHDKVERYQNEQGFIYVHHLQLLGAIELLNARDLTDCGFNDRTYNVQDFILRLFSLSNFEYNYNAEYFFQTNFVFLEQSVDFIKTFENYTLLSALREFLDAYNMCGKLGFNTTYYENTDTYLITYPMLYIIPKTGDIGLTTHTMDDFDDVRETKTMDKNSFGATVVSNAENVISSGHKTFPSVGGVMLSSNENQVTYSNALIRLPSNAFLVNWVKILHGIFIKISCVYPNGDYEDDFLYKPFISENTLKNKILDLFAQHSYPDTIKNDFLSKLSTTIDTLNKAGTITIYNGNKLVPYFGSNNNSNGEVIIEKGTNVPYLAELYDRKTAKDQKITLIDKNNLNVLPLEYQGIVWERGSNIISNFTMFKTGLTDGFVLQNFKNTDLRLDDTQVYAYRSSLVSGFTLTIEVRLETGQLLQIKNSSFIVDYVPMTNLKVKVDNTREKKDTQLYNQNGRLNDNVALSKLINSYSKTISSDTITKYMCYYDYNEVPKVGSFVYKDNETYVINNVSLDFVQHEADELGTFGYFIEGEFTMSKYCATKSLMTNPNTNIRDYGIPQNFNVKRKQVYRDYYELGYGQYDGANQETPYLSLDYIFSFGHTPNELPTFIGIIKLGYDDLVEGEYNWYYQLETTNYQLEKMLYIVLDFNDNNIIGYGSQNVWCGFVPSRIFRNMTDTVNTPVSYTDGNGQVKSIDLLFLTNEQITSIYNEYQEEEGGSTWEGSLYNYSVFIPSEIYEKALDNHTIQISEPFYNKDALEVPVFEYACQIDDSEDVLIGDNILTQHEDCLYFYTFIEGEHLTQTNVIDTNTISSSTGSSYVDLEISNGATMEIVSFGAIKMLQIKIYDSQRARVSISGSTEWSNGTQQTFEIGKDYAIFRHSINVLNNKQTSELMLIAKKVPNTHLASNKTILNLELNYYKLK